MEKTAVATTPPITSLGMRAVLSEIDDYRSLEQNWDLEDAEPIAPEAADSAAELVTRISAAVGIENVDWEDVEVGPAADGSIMLAWEGRNRRLLFVARPGHPVSVELFADLGGGETNRRLLSLDEAVDYAVRALSG